MIYTLFIWTVVAMAGDRYYIEKKYDWRPVAQFESAELCVKGAQTLGVVDRARCVRTK